MVLKIKLLAFAVVCAATVAVFKTARLYQYSQVFILVLWALFFLFLMGSLIYRYRFAGTFGVMGCSVLILAGTLIPGDLKMSCYHHIITFIHQVGVEPGRLRAAVIFRASHLGLFAVLGLILGRYRGSASVWYGGCHIVMLAAGTELAQLFVGGRHGRVEDFSVDCMGGMLGMLGGVLWAWMKNLKLKASSFNTSSPIKDTVDIKDTGSDIS